MAYKRRVLRIEIETGTHATRDARQAIIQLRDWIGEYGVGLKFNDHAIRNTAGDLIGTWEWEDKPER